MHFWVGRKSQIQVAGGYGAMSSLSTQKVARFLNNGICTGHKLMIQKEQKR